MKFTRLSALFTLVAIATTTQLSAAELRFSLGVRETNNPAGTAIGSNGGATGTIEFVGRQNNGTDDLDVTLVPADNAWHAVTFDLNAGPFRGFTGDHIVSSTTGLGVLEHLRIANTTDGVKRYIVYIDDVVNTVNGTPTLLTNFDAAAAGAEVMFQDARFSGSTSANLLTTPNTNGVSSDFAVSGANSYKLEFEFVDDSPTGVGSAGRWARVTSSSATTLPNPVIGVPGGSTNTSTVSMQLRVVAIPEPATAALGAMVALALAAARRRA
jgi:hypothetical protein